MPSTVIRSFSYAKVRRLLTVVFQSGEIYDYFEVPETVYAELAAAPSKGQYFNVHVRPAYRFLKRPRRSGEAAGYASRSSR